MSRMFNKANMKHVRAELEKALAEFGEKFDVSINVGTIRYSEDSFNCKLNAARVVEGMSFRENEIAKAWVENVYRFNLSADAFGQKFIMDHEIVTVIGLKPRNSKYPVIVKTEHGDKQYKLSVRHFNSLQKVK